MSYQTVHSMTVSYQYVISDGAFDVISDGAFDDGHQMHRLTLKVHTVWTLMLMIYHQYDDISSDIIICSVTYNHIHSTQSSMRIPLCFSTRRISLFMLHETCIRLHHSSRALEILQAITLAMKTLRPCYHTCTANTRALL